MRKESEPPAGFWRRLLAWFRRRLAPPRPVGRRPVPPRRRVSPPSLRTRPTPPVAPAPAPAATAPDPGLQELREGLQRLEAELRQLRAALPGRDHRSIIIERVDHLTVEQLYHIIGRLAVDQLDGTLNVGFSRNLRVHPRMPKPDKAPPIKAEGPRNATTK